MIMGDVQCKMCQQNLIDNFHITCTGNFPTFHEKKIVILFLHFPEFYNSIILQLCITYTKHHFSQSSSLYVLLAHDKRLP